MTDPTQVNATITRAQRRLRAGDRQGALAVLEEALAQNPASCELHMNLAMVHRAGGSLVDAVLALNAALAIEPYSFMALLSKGSILEQMGRIRAAARVYRDALRITPAESSLPSGLRGPLARAREVVAEQAQDLAEHLRGALSDLRAQCHFADLRRFDESLDVLAGISKVYNAEPIQFHYPRLPAIPFFEREHFPWMKTLEAATDTIRGELMALLDADLAGFAPYVQYAPGTPENQFASLNHNAQWSSLWLWKDGERRQQAVARCPQTAAILDQLPLADLPRFAPTALFSALAPHTRIPPHTGSTNTRLLVHLPLVLPGPAGFRVGNETREWKIGTAWAFDDTIEHEAWNDADATRVIMIFDIWNPLLSAAERELITALLTAHSEWLQGVSNK